MYCACYRCFYFTGLVAVGGIALAQHSSAIPPKGQPDAAKDKPSRGTIIAIGTGKLLDDGTRGEMQVKKGDRVLFTSDAPETIEIDDQEYLLMSESDILAVIE